MSLLYFDVGLGAMIVQGIVAATAVVVLFSKSVMYKIKLFFGLVKESDYDSIDIDENDTPVDDE
ncbi:hypothetical protein [Dokdonia sp.]|uniref:hypothetical protein n=1 Tax=Dokdonia sp. TaxID=2024995 RepID=UPI003265C2C2